MFKMHLNTRLLMFLKDWSNKLWRMYLTVLPFCPAVVWMIQDDLI